MKKILYSCLLAFIALTIYASKANAQYHITSQSWTPVFDSGYCHYPTLYITTNAYTTGLSIKTYYGNGYLTTSPVNNGGTYGYANCYSDYSFPGTYTVKHVLFNGTTPVDSIISPHELLYCSDAIIKCVNDSLGTGIYNSSLDHFIIIPLKLEVDYNGAPVDTVTITSGTYYRIEGSIGDIYAFRVLSVLPGLSLTFPSSGVIYDTIQAISNNYIPQFFGFKCSGATSFDVAVNAVIPVTGIHDQWGNIYVTNASCDPVDATVTLTFSPKYGYYTGGAYPAPSSVSGNTLTWELPGLNMLEPVDFRYQVWDEAGDLAAGDTVQEHVTVTPTTGDLDPTNNTEIIIDTVKAGVDPNEMSVSPSGYISAGTKLQYTISFENTGNDTAFNISVYDTLSNYVDAQSLNIIMASAVMNIAVINVGPHSIVKFDFPNINLLDSSHHGQCDGAVIFTVNTLNGLASGTTIFNHAGIFFDYNPVVMTDTVEDIIGWPASVTALNQMPKVEVYPNPANDELTIKADNSSYNMATITNAIGQVILEQPLNTTQTKVNVSKLAPGMYMITLRGDSGVKVQKFDKM